ncbi:TPA: DUF2388 domain-containing protein [Pseudomonas putida]|uniref:DUF2388 domain-containing protein n=1 Tax=Pseudomonas TaxID=286 RepID=UPI0006D48060|nr:MULTISPECIES: DUF2388 domain-containing protein [Pseudomonas]RSC25348.1 DUF2388 domain-containing protein [Pseudomonas putida]HEK1767594.1 DUF2388 domain-containing protein [Pseudomonas putida]
MHARTAIGIALLTAVSHTIEANENANPFEAALMITTLAPTIVLAGTTALTSNTTDSLKSAKDDALAFIGSDGAIRGVRFEQARRDYRASTAPPFMSDRQLALAIVAIY